MYRHRIIFSVDKWNETNGEIDLLFWQETRGIALFMKSTARIFKRIQLEIFKKEKSHESNIDRI